MHPDFPFPNPFFMPPSEVWLYPPTGWQRLGHLPFPVGDAESLSLELWVFCDQECAYILMVHSHLCIPAAHHYCAFLLVAHPSSHGCACRSAGTTSPFSSLSSVLSLAIFSSSGRSPLKNHIFQKALKAEPLMCHTTGAIFLWSLPAVHEYLWNARVIEKLIFFFYALGDFRTYSK